MKIVRPNQHTFTQVLANLACGQCFESPGLTGVWFKTTHGSTGSQTYCTNLSDGSLRYFSNGELVKPVEAEVHIRHPTR